MTYSKNKIALISVCIVAVIAGGYWAKSWWSENRMMAPCLLLGDWGKSGLTSIQLAEEEAFISPNRTIVLIRHDDYGKCGEKDKRKHWENISHLAEERNWAEAQYWMALKLAYGDFSGLLPPQASGYADYSEEIFAIPKDFGDGEGIDVEASYEWLKLSADQGFPLAEGVLSHAYLIGRWGEMQIEVNKEESMRLLELYSQRNLQYSNYNRDYYHGLFFLAQRYLSGEKYGLPPDYAKGIEYLEKSVDKNFPPAMVEFSRAYACGYYGLEVNIAKAKEWHEKAKQRLIELHGDRDTSGWKDYIAQNSELINSCFERKKHNAL